MSHRALLITAAALPLAACAPQTDREPDIRAPQITVAGEPVNCVQVNRIDRTQVHDDYTIDFIMLNNQRLRNTLPSRCFSLGFQERFAYEARGGRLCSQDTIQVLYSDGNTGSICGLGEFLPVELAD